MIRLLIKHVCYALLVLFAIKTSAQTTEDFKKLKEENAYLRKSLNIKEASLKQATSDSFSFSLIRCTGNKTEKQIDLEILITNLSGNRKIQFSPDTYARAIDVQGNVYTPDAIKIGAEKYASDIYQDVPLKLSFSFVKLDPSVALLKLISLKYFVPGRYVEKEVLFKDIPVT
ncbi:hypothetical protein [Niabella sp.]|uniref:hypothetical protein n=1 Tax=Niabella sp. TaxID=1962976 RepID=UPI00263730E2|nr:hypothetical protein [Niabella sp.]